VNKHLIQHGRPCASLWPICIKPIQCSVEPSGSDLPAITQSSKLFAIGEYAIRNRLIGVDFGGALIGICHNDKIGYLVHTHFIRLNYRFINGNLTGNATENLAVV
jgi:hypothetical protein